MPEPIVLDSNLLVSAIIQPRGAAAQAFALAMTRFEAVISTETLAELADVLSRDKFDVYASRAVRKQWVLAYAEAARMVPVTQAVHDCRDAKDNKFLALALTAGAKLILTGDKRDLLAMHPYQGVSIVGLRAFLDGAPAL